MKKIILLLAILSSVHFFAQAQTNTTRGSASLSIQKAEQESVQETLPTTTILSDSLAGATSLDDINLSLTKGFAEMEFDSWSVYHYMIANESSHYETSMPESTGKRRLNKRYSKVTHTIDSPKD